MDGGGDLEEKDGTGAGSSSSGKGKNIKSLVKRKKEEKPRQEKISVITPKKGGAGKKINKEPARELTPTSPKEFRPESALKRESDQRSSTKVCCGVLWRVNKTFYGEAKI